MLGHSAIADAAIADVGGVVQAGVAEMSAIGSAASVGVGTLVGTSNISGIFTQNAEVSTKVSGNIDVSSNFIVTGENIALVNVAVASLDTNFTKTVQGNFTTTGTSSQQINFTKTASGDILFIDLVTDATTETYTEITPSGTETYTEITPSGTETYTEIVR
tara:strand:+ start:978 stop:1460 length:483 start_codon:yes stop_codon:yes gene_type:complete